MPYNEKPIFTKVNEQNRTYCYYKSGESFQIRDILELNVSPTGTHRINTKDGKKHIVYRSGEGLIHIQFEAEDWTF